MDARRRVGVKKSKREMESSSTGMGSKSKPFKNFFRTAVPQMVKLGPNQASIYVASPPPIPDGPSRPTLKTCLCKFGITEGCQFGDECQFANCEWELGKPISQDDLSVMVSGRFPCQRMPSSPPFRFGGPLTATICVDASVARAVICAKNVICLKTDVKLFIQEPVSDPNPTNIKLEGNFDQVKRAIDMVINLISKNPGVPASQMVGPNQASIYVASPPPILDGPSRPSLKIRLCNEYNTDEGCRFGEKCHFAHGKGELGKPISLNGQVRHSSRPSSIGGLFTSKISVDASLVRAVNAKKKIFLERGVKLFIQDHESDPNLRSVELKGKFGEVNMALDMVIELIGKIRASQPSIYK